MFSCAFETDEPLIRSCLLFIYGKNSKLPNFTKLCLNSNNNEVSLFTSYLNDYLKSGQKFVPQAAILSFLKLKTPKWNEEIGRIESQYASTMNCVDQMLNIELSLTDNYPEIVRSFIPKITDFMDHYKKCKMLISEIRGQFSDYLPFLEESEEKIKFSICYLEQFDNDQEKNAILNNLYESNDKNVFIHYAIAEALNSQKELALAFLKSQIEHLNELKKQTPNYDLIFDKYRNDLKDIGSTLETRLFDKFNTFYYFVLARDAVTFVQKTLANCCSTCAQSNIICNDECHAVMKQTFQSFRLFCASMALKRPELSEEQSKYHMIKKEKECINMRDKLKSTDEMETEIATINNGIDQMNQYSSICILCNKYCASYICPHCHLCLYCLLCKKSNFICPGCHELIEEPLKLNKTSYFGDEFRIDLLKRRAKQLKEQQVQ